MNLIRFGVSMDRDLVTALDEFAAQERYPNRSEALRSLVQQALLKDAHSTRDGQVAGVVSLLHRHGQRLKEVPIAPYPSLSIAANLKLHLMGDVCLKLLVVQGSAADVREWSRVVTSQRGVVGECSIVATADLAGIISPESAAGGDHHRRPASLILTRGDEQLFVSHGSWLHPLFELEGYLQRSGTDPRACRLYDKLIGRAAALIIVRLGIRTLRTGLLSRLAEAVLIEHGVDYAAEELVDRIDCRTEELLSAVNDPDEAYRIICDRIAANRAAAAGAEGAPR